MNIIVCFNKPKDVNAIRTLLCHHGYRVAFSCMAGRRALEFCEKLSGGIIVCGYRLNDMLCEELFENMPRGFSMITMCSPEKWELSLPPKGMSCLDMPARASALLDMIETVWQRAETERRAEKQKARLGMAGRSREELAAIQRAKALLMETRGYDEPRAHRYLQEAAMTSGLSLSETAAKVIVSLCGMKAVV